MTITFLLACVNINLSAEDADLIAYYSFDGNAEDSSGNGNHGEVKGDSEWVMVNSEMQYIYK